MEDDQGDLLDIVRATVASSINIHDHHGRTWQEGRPRSGVAQKMLREEMMNQQPCNISSQMLQISPRATQASSVLIGDCPVGDMSRVGEQQISRPATLRLKSRKYQAKKVVCIPAATAASSRPSGDQVVPSDLWAWRKYGQKPIKGSPYPRAYYRCSSSKRCSARKQVERSRTDPNLLVITYTSEHKHPKPTQRNALAGSTRGQPSKNSSSSPKSSPQDLKEEPPKETISSISTSIVKEEVREMEKAMTPSSNQTNDLLAYLAELDPEPMSLIFSEEFIVDSTYEERENKNLDPFNMFDW